MFTKMFLHYFPVVALALTAACLAINLGSVLMMTSAIAMSSTPTGSVGVEKWVVVSDQVTMNGGPTTAHLRWVISPKGDWFIVPEAHRSRFSGIENGAELTMPASAPAWDRPYGRHTDWTHELQMGRSVTTRAEPGYRAAFEPTCFYVAKK
jgi:hypothetical protein